MDTFESKFSGVLNSPPTGSLGGTDLNVSEERLNLRTTLKIGTWNTQSLFEAGKLANLVQEMSRLRIDILGVAETWWPDSGICPVENGVFYYSRNQDRNHRKGVGIIISKNLIKYVVDFVPYPDRTALIKFRAKPVDLNIIQLYASTADSNDQDIEEFYSDVKGLLKSTKKQEVNIVMGDLNAKILSRRTYDSNQHMVPTSPSPPIYLEITKRPTRERYP
ncbi:craniofacial development protein 2-like [Diorhabda carinulata]|uniref:craniofacial development protein 2-like n=1 Tax=Diorhabda carinulata TaxID=1163345 RepID=UPI0025A14039|nr:craniofacial development protein 2-like [Diorhabda carinulata]